MLSGLAKKEKKSKGLGLRLAGTETMLVVRFQAERGGTYLLAGGAG